MKKVAQYTKNVPGMADSFGDSVNGIHSISVAGRILELGIQAPPGSKFSLNNSLSDKGTNALIIGGIGIYQLNLTDYYTKVTKVYFQFNETAEKSPIIVDLTYEVV